MSGTQPPVVPFWMTQIKEKIVTNIPLEFIWTAEEQVEASRERYLTPTDLTDMLKIHPVEFIVADVGAPLKRIPVHQCYEFWQSEVKRHLLSPDGKVVCPNFLGNMDILLLNGRGILKFQSCSLRKYTERPNPPVAVER